MQMQQNSILQTFGSSTYCLAFVITITDEVYQKTCNLSLNFHMKRLHCILDVLISIN